MNTLQQIYNNLQAGLVYGELFTNCTFPVFRTVLYLSSDGKYICWNHFGSSANQNTLNDLRFIVEDIFECSPEKFVQRYDCKTTKEAATVQLSVNHYKIVYYNDFGEMLKIETVEADRYSAVYKTAAKNRAAVPGAVYFEILFAD